MVQVDRHLHEPNLMTVDAEVACSSETSEETQTCCKTLEDGIFDNIISNAFCILKKQIGNET